MTDHEGVDRKELNFQDLKKGSSDVFRIFFLKFYGEFFSFASLLLRSREPAKKLTSAAFFMLWEKHRDFDHERNIRAFLYTCIRDGSLQYLRWLQQNPEPEKYTPGEPAPNLLPGDMMKELLAYADRIASAE